jgi:uncharacterized membrane protein YGL010W
MASLLMGDRPWEWWVGEYAKSHTHPVNRACHTIGIPTVAGSVVLGILGIGFPPLLIPAAGLFVFGWILQFIGHAFEGKRPEFFRDLRFLFVGLRWWTMKMRGQA